jgi:hypothetical protein
VKRRPRPNATATTKRRRTPAQTERTTRRAATATADGPQTIDHDARTVEAVIATDAPVRIYDYTTERYLDEVLAPAGMVEPARMPLRADHSRWGVRDVIGRVGRFSITDSGSAVTAVLRFSRAADVEEIWQRVADGDLYAVSIGARYLLSDCVEIPEGESMRVDGRKYTAAADAPTRVVRTWSALETSVVDEGADARAVIRSAQPTIGTRETDPLEFCEMPLPVQRGQSLEGVDMKRRVRRNAAASATTKTRNRRATAGQIADDQTTTERANADADSNDAAADDELELEEFGANDDDATDTAAVVNRADALARTIETAVQAALARNATPNAAGQTGPADAAAIETARRDERERVARIRDLGQGLPARLVDRAINDGWTADRFAVAALQRLQRRSNAAPPRQSGDGVNRAPAGHVARSGATVDALQAAVLLRAGVQLDNPAFATEQGRTMLERAGVAWLPRFNSELESNGNSDLESIVETGRRFQRDPASRTCERILEINSRRAVPSDTEEIVQRAFSNPFMPRVFGALVSAGVVAGYMEYADSTEGWTSETEWADFRQNQPIGIDANQGLRLHTRNTTAKDVDFADYGEAYSVARYSGKFQLDDQDIIDDVAGFNAQIFVQMGRMAGRLRPDLIYAILLTNANLTDGVPLFHSSRGNALTANPLGIAGVVAAEAAMATRTVTSKAGRPTALNLMAGHLIVPRALRATGKQIANSTLIVSGNTTDRGNLNPHDGEYSLHSDARLDIGVNDPRTEQTVTGSASTWYAAEREGSQTIQVGYRRGTGKAPVMRVRPLTGPGQFGIGWDMVLDIGAGVITPRGLVRNVAT